MLFDFESWKSSFLSAATRTFGERAVCVGVQGSRARGEARPDSDIDTVLVLDSLSPEDLADYRMLLSSLPFADLVCGFISSKAVLEQWDEGELVGFYFDTECLLGSLDFLLPHIKREAARNSAHQAACGLYHALCHAAVFEPVPLSARAFAKSAFFLLRARNYAQTGIFPLRLTDLLPMLTQSERALLAPLSGADTGASNQAADLPVALAACGSWMTDLADAAITPPLV